MPGPLAALGLQLGSQAASQAISGIQGQIFGKMDDRRQYKLQEKLQALGIQGQQQMVDYNMAKQLQMWENTNYKAQIEQLEKAGLNPGLLYGMNGGGGATTGAPSVATGAAQAGRGAGQIGMGIHNIAELALLKAQKENIEADTENKRATTPKIETETKSLTQGIENQKAQEALTKIQTDIAKLDAQYLKESLEDRLTQIFQTAQSAIQTTDILEQQKLLDRQQREDKVTLLQLQIAEKIITNTFTSQKIEESQAQIQKWATELQQAWSNLDRQERELQLKSWSEQIRAKYPGMMQVVGRMLNETANGIGNLFGQKTETHNAPNTNKK